MPKPFGGVSADDDEADRIHVDSAIYGVPFTNTFAYKPLLA